MMGNLLPIRGKLRLDVGNYLSIYMRRTPPMIYIRRLKLENQAYEQASVGDLEGKNHVQGF